MSATDTQLAAVRAAVEPAVAALECDLYDVDLVGGGNARTLRVTVTRPGGVDLDTITAVTHAVSPIVDEAPELRGSFLLEVSSPGIERVLRRPEHFRGAIDEQVSVKYHTNDGPRRLHGVLRACDDESIVVESEHGEREVIDRSAITQARTVFEWGPAPRPGKGKPGRARAKERS